MLTATRFSRVAMLSTLVGAGTLIGMATSAVAQTAGTAQAGVAAAVRGEVHQVSLALQPPADRGQAVGRIVASGDRIFLNDHIRTGPQAGLQIMLMDESIFTIGPNAELVIDRFVYDPNTDAGTVAASIVKGAFRFVSGRIAKRNPGDMNLQLGTAALGIRGTAAAGAVSDTAPDGTPGQVVDVVLLGPGPNNNADERDGRITLNNGGSSVEISRPGFGTTITGDGGTPSIPVRWSPEKFRAITGRTEAGNGGTNGGTDGGNGGNGGNASGGGIGGNFTELSGQTLGASLQTVSVVQQSGETSQTSDAVVEDASVNAISSALNTMATFDDLRTINSGYAIIAFSNVPLTYVSGPTTGSSGSFSGGIEIDFAMRYYVPFVSQAQYSFGQRTNQSFSYGETIDYNALSGAAGSSASSASNPGAFGSSTTDTFSVATQVQNDTANGVVAAAGTMSVTVQSGTDNTVITGQATVPSTLLPNSVP